MLCASLASVRDHQYLAKGLSSAELLNSVDSNVIWIIGIQDHGCGKIDRRTCGRAWSICARQTKKSLLTPQGWLRPLFGPCTPTFSDYRYRLSNSRLSQCLFLNITKRFPFNPSHETATIGREEPLVQSGGGICMMLASRLR